MEALKEKSVSALQCSTCVKRFGKKSPLVRHFKICTGSILSRRKKSCDGCVFAKSKCDLLKPSCGRCQSRNISCSYDTLQRAACDTSANKANHENIVCSDDLAHTTSLSIHTSGTGWSLSATDQSIGDVAMLPPQPLANTTKSLTFISLMTLLSEGSDTGGLVEAYAESRFDSERHPPFASETSGSPFGPGSMNLTFRVLRTWPRMMAKDFQSPPLLHHTHLAQHRITKSLAHCYTIVRMWNGQSEESAGLVRETAVREMTRLFQNYKMFDGTELVAALQALAIYMIILLFPRNDHTTVFAVDLAILANAQELVNYVGRMGLMIQEETRRVRPSWETWINITSRRRAVLTLYLVHWSLSAYHGLTSFDCHELKYMPAPAPKLLWQAKDREDWASHYDRWLLEWGRDEFLHGEVAEAGLGISGDIRCEKWLGETDELGLFLITLAETVRMERHRPG